MKMTKAKFNALEKVFTAEIADCLPFQSKAQVYTFLEEDGLVQKETTTLVGWGQVPVTVTGWFLTERGRMEYCQACG